MISLTKNIFLHFIFVTGEGLDFKAEVVNKDVQSWMPRGVPSGEDWLRVTRNLKNLKEVSLIFFCYKNTLRF